MSMVQLAKELNQLHPALPTPPPKKKKSCLNILPHIGNQSID